jgi:hypothetical protein
MHKPIRQMTNTELSDYISSVTIRALHLLHNDTDSIRKLAREAVAKLASALDGTDDEFDHYVPKALMMLAILDHMTDRRTVGEVCDYLNF